MLVISLIVKDKQKEGIPRGSEVVEREEWTIEGQAGFVSPSLAEKIDKLATKYNSINRSSD